MSHLNSNWEHEAEMPRTNRNLYSACPAIRRPAGMPPSSEHTLLPIDAPCFSWCPNLGDQGCTGIFQPKENYFLCFSFVPLQQTAGSFVQTMWAAELKNFCQLYTLSKQKVNKTHSSKLKCFKGKLQQLGF